ncbi:MAG: TetR/AcrR family transcriptional regulator [Isosphaera sp.]|nr:TetR/AcrR family transcriptional regulator [Isosphaera sp.]
MTTPSATDATDPAPPRTARGRPRDPELEARRRAEILRVAAGEFARHGFANTQVQTIADRVGVGNGTVFRYFPTKENLFLEAVRCGLAELDAAMDAVLALPLDPVEQLAEAVRAYLAFFAGRPDLAELFIQERAAFPHHHRPLYFATQEAGDHACKHAAFFDRLMATGRVRRMPMDRLFAVLGDLLYGVILTNLLAGRRIDPDAQARDILDVIFHGILADEEARA